MNYKYKQAGIAGKFRLIHKAHVELILRAMTYTEKLHVFIVDSPQYKRYATLDELIACFETIFEHLAYHDYAIHVIQGERSGIAWDKKLLELVPDLEAMFDSKEHYDNTLLKNEYIELAISKDVSVTKMEQSIYKNEHFWLVAEAFKPYLTKKIIITGEDELHIAQLIEKLRMYYDAFVVNLADIDDADQLFCCPKKLILINETLDQVQKSAQAEQLNDIDHVVYLQKTSDIQTLSELTNCTRFVLRAPESDFAQLIETIDRLLQADAKDIGE